MKFQRCHRIGLFLFSLCLSLLSQQARSGTSSIGVEDPLGGTRYLFVSPVDQKVWGIVCPGTVETYVGKPQQEILRCGYTQSIGPVTMDDLLNHIPHDVDPYTLEQALRNSSLVPVATSRDKYYEIWSIAESLSGASRPLPTGHQTSPCPESCQPSGISFSVDVNSQSSTIYIYATQGQGHVGSFIVGDSEANRIFYLNAAQKALLNLNCGTTTLYISRVLKDQIIVNRNGGYARYFYF